MQKISEREKERGKLAEREFKSWLESKQLPYIYFDQKQSSFSQALKGVYDGRRPDFMLLVPLVGPLFVDVKHRRKDDKWDALPIDCEDNDRDRKMFEHFGIVVWYAVSSEELEYKEWYWIPAIRVSDVAETKKKSRNSQKDFYRVRLAEFSKVVDTKSIGDVLKKFLL